MNAKKDVPIIGYGRHILEQQNKQKEPKPTKKQTDSKLTIKTNEVKFVEVFNDSGKTKALRQTQSIAAKKIVKDESYFTFNYIEGESLFGIKTQKVDYSSNDKPQDEGIKKVSANFAKAIVKEAEQDYPEVDEFLASVNLERHKDLFIANGFEDLDSILELKDEHFQFMQLPLGHKLKILKRVKELKKDLPAAEHKASSVKEESEQVDEKSKEEAKTSLLNGTYDEEENRKEFLKAREAWLKERQEATKVKEETKGGFFADVGGDAWNMPAMPEYTEEGTGMSPKNEQKKKEAKDCCFGCFKFFNKGDGFEDKEIRKAFCSKKCFDKYFKEYAVNCKKCNKKLLSEKAIFKDKTYFCSEECSKALYKEKELQDNPEETNKQIDEMLQLESL